ncbi:hypothetical protein KL933_004022 [Ogataea haglerorum]|uniref:Kinesin-like protein n=1 Tax=Ogataea haglerorum TaxID=1937702 RepID=A0AAN6D2M4_9ASCO|nr:uncharacterized protein KL911_004291 [Ogataea haglerorum]KAG7725456.1 hypothetical protein KL933_004022 [Ogataea haglerorum]KAG7746675.1 hypothetical protein KL912_004252 [Ogataea haglerorum]KAG7752045.1 hypothetical protein KL911_004291 [Ogataea haglerorum]KAG7798872.1 hypothetical protein KL944_004271 [Ogataea haglerorum]
MTLKDISNISVSRRIGDRSPPRKAMKPAKVIEDIQRSRKLELQKVLEWKDKNQQELNDLNSELWRIRTDLPELELDLEKLNNQLFELEKRYKEKENELAEADKRLESEIAELKQEFELYRRQTELEFNRKIEQLSADCDSRVQSEIAQKQAAYTDAKRELEKRKDELVRQINEEKAHFQSENERIIERRRVRLEAVDREFARELNNLEQDKKEIARAAAAVDLKCEAVGAEIAKKEEEKQELESQVNSARLKSAQFEEKTVEIRREIQTLKTEFQEKVRLLEQKEHDAAKFANSTVALKEQLLSEEQTRRKTHNILQDLKGNIRVFCRVKPEQAENCFKHQMFASADSSDGKEHIIITEPLVAPQPFYGFSKSAPKNYKFGFDKVFGMDSTNSEIFDEISQLVQSALDGYNVCIFAYGQTGSGKTFTMSSVTDGIIPRAVDLIFQRSRSAKENGWEFSITGQFLEIYNENINDLMTESYLRNLDAVKHEIKHDEATRTTTITDMTTVALENQEQVAHILENANKNRATASTNVNHRSSRSHSIFMIQLCGHNKKTGESVNGKLNLIDLAGSERISQSMVTGERLKETQSINRSLSSLGDVITSLCKRSQHIPYRNSRLTYLLQYSLGGDSKTLMFVNISTKLQHFNETLNSLRFATKVNNTQLQTKQ